MPKEQTALNAKRDEKRSGLVDDRGGTFDPGNEQGILTSPKRRAVDTHDIYTDPANLPEGLQRKPKGPLGPTQGRRGGNK
jgi:hypothetical protein